MPKITIETPSVKLPSPHNADVIFHTMRVVNAFAGYFDVDVSATLREEKAPDGESRNVLLFGFEGRLGDKVGKSFENFAKKNLLLRSICIKPSHAELESGDFSVKMSFDKLNRLQAADFGFAVDEAAAAGYQIAQKISQLKRQNSSGINR